MHAILRTPRKIARGGEDFTRYQFTENLNGTPEQIVYRPIGEPRRDLFKVAYITPAGDVLSPICIDARPGGVPPAPQLFDVVSGQVADFSALPFVITANDLGFIKYSLEVCGPGGVVLGSVKDQDFPVGGALELPLTAPPDPEIVVVVKYFLHRSNNQCVSGTLELHQTASARESVHIDTDGAPAAGVVIPQSDLIYGDQSGELVLLEMAQFGEVIMPPPRDPATGQPTTGHPILVPKGTGAASVGATVAVVYSLDRYDILTQRNEGLWIDWPAGDPGGAYTIDAVMGSVPVVRQQTPGVIEVVS